MLPFASLPFLKSSSSFYLEHVQNQGDSECIDMFIGNLSFHCIPSEGNLSHLSNTCGGKHQPKVMRSHTQNIWYTTCIDIWSCCNNSIQHSASLLVNTIQGMPHVQSQVFITVTHGASTVLKVFITHLHGNVAKKLKVWSFWGLTGDL